MSTPCAQLYTGVPSLHPRLQLQGAMCFGVEDSERLLLRAAIEGDNTAVARLLHDGALPDAVVDGEGRTALHWAAYWNNARMVRALLAKGADVHRQMSHRRGWTALHVAAANGSGLAVRSLLEGGAQTGVCGWALVVVKVPRGTHY